MAKTLLLFVLLFALPAAGASHAFDPDNTDILNLRLGMPLQTVEAILTGQGIPPQRWERRTHPCPKDTAATCLTEVLAPTRDGKLAIGFSPTTGSVRRIDYTFKANGAGEPDMIRASVMHRFGDPSDVTDTVWCPRISAKGTCPADRPTLRLRHGAGVTLVLSLSDGSAD